jgi:hypothetical protein
VRRVEVYVDPNGVESDEPTPGAKRTVTYQRERVYRRQTINEKIEEALSAADERSVKIGVDATTVLQTAGRTEGDESLPTHHARAGVCGSFFAAKVAQHTSFFADVVAPVALRPTARFLR